jgi:transposase
MLDEQRQLIESLKANLHRLLKWQFGPKSEHLNVEQLCLFVDGNVVIEVPESAPADHAERSNTSPATSERRRAVRVLRNLPRVIEEIDMPETQKSCPCCGEALSPFGHESSEQLHYIPPGSKSTRRGAGSIPAATATGPWFAHPCRVCHRSPGAWPRRACRLI